MTVKTMSWLLLLTATVTVCAAPYAMAAPAATQLFPATTKLFLATEDIHAFDARWKESRLSALMDDKAMRPFMDAWRQLDATEPTVQLAWADLLDVSSGAASFGVVAGASNEPASILLVDTRGKRDHVAKLMKRLASDLLTRGAKRSDTTVADTRVVVYEYDVTIDKKTHKVRRAYFLRDDVFGASDNLALIKDVFSRWTAPAASSLAALPAFQSIEKRTSHVLADNRAGGVWYLDPFGYEQITRAQEKADPDSGWQRALRQGFGGIQRLGGAVVFPGDGVDVMHQLAIFVPKPLVKTAAMLAFERLLQTGLPDWVPADVGRVALLGWDLGAAFTAYGSWFDEVYGEGEEGIFEEVVIGIRDDPGSPGVDIRKDLLSALAGPVIVVGGAAQLKATAGDPTLFAIKAKDERQVLRAVDKMLTGDPDVETRQLDGTKTWVFRDTSKKADNDEAFGPDLSKVAVCVAHGYMMVATDVDLLASVLANKSGAGPLSQTSEYQRAMRYIAPQADKRTILRQYTNPRIDLHGLYDQLRAGSIQDATSPRGRLIAALVDSMEPSAADQPARGLPWDKLPEFGFVQQYLGVGAAVGHRDDDGWSIQSLILTGDAKK